MQRSSESIASLASALAKAQAELVNPEKTLTATISTGRSAGGGATERSFRYASLSSGLDIVRKTLGLHEIATMQTTAIDQTSGMVNLTTMLAHASGEWIASDWPVCPIADTATPRRMGAALTYARRYALFTLVGIAGEDDLDAPDLPGPTTTIAEPENPKANGNGRSNGAHHSPAPLVAARRLARVTSSPTTQPALAPEASAELRDRLLGEISGLMNSDDAAVWALRSLPGKNRLTATDAERVEEVFRGRLESLANEANSSRSEPTPPTAATTAFKEESPPPAASPALMSCTASHGPKETGADSTAKRPRRQRSKPIVTVIDKSVLALSEPRRVRDRDHVKYVGQQPCLICGRNPSDAHHLRFSQSRALGRKVSDEFTVPLCRGHHREIHRHGDEIAWWKNAGLDPTITARTLWLQTHPLPATSDEIREVASIATIGTDWSDAKHALPVSGATEL